MCPLDEIVKWNVERRLDTFYAPFEHSMLTEELQEFLMAYSEQDEHEMVDALCDIIVVAAGSLYKLGYNPRKALSETTKEINSRVGSYDEDVGKWKKDPNQDPDTLYKANYESARSG